VGDQGCPHPEQALRERNQPHGPPDGPIIVSMNDMMGPAPGPVKRGQPLDPRRYPMPDPESKPRPRHSYRNGAILSHMAHVGRTYVAGFKDDGRHMFFQFEHSPEEERTCAFIVVIPFPLVSPDGAPVLYDDGTARTELWFTLVIGTCMNMGSRNAGKIAQRFTDRILEGFAQLLDVYVRDEWLPKQTPELRTLLAERSATLGPRQARPFDTSGYTDELQTRVREPRASRRRRAHLAHGLPRMQLLALREGMRGHGLGLHRRQARTQRRLWVHLALQARTRHRRFGGGHRRPPHARAARVAQLLLGARARMARLPHGHAQRALRAPQAPGLPRAAGDAERPRARAASQDHRAPANEARRQLLERRRRGRAHRRRRGRGRLRGSHLRAAHH